MQWDMTGYVCNNFCIFFMASMHDVTFVFQGSSYIESISSRYRYFANTIEINYLQAHCENFAKPLLAICNRRIQKAYNTLL